MEWAILFLILWVVASVINYGATFAFFQKEYPMLAVKDKVFDRNCAIFMGATGLIGLIPSLYGSKFCKHGFKWR